MNRLPIAATRAVGAMVSAMAASLSQLGPEGEIFAPVFESFSALIGSIGALSAAILNLSEEDIAAFKAASFDLENVSLAMAASITAGFATIANGLAAIGSLLQAKTAQTVAKYDEMIAAEKRVDGKSEESLAKIRMIEKKNSKRKAFETDKKIKMATVVASTAAGIAAALPLLANPLTAPIGKVLMGIIAGIGAAQLAIISSLSYSGGASGAGGGAQTPTVVTAGERRSTVDLAKSQSASGEIGYFRGERGTGGPENFRPAFMGAKYRAMGGPTAGYVVGEQGPELFVPSTPGTIVPEPETGLGTPINATFNINTIDASGVEEVLTAQQGNIIGMLRESANSYGNSFLEEVDTSIYSDTTGGMSRA